MASGVVVSPDCHGAFKELSEGKKLRYIIYKIDDKNVIVESSVTSDEVFR
jgi:hypothetical protein